LSASTPDVFISYKRERRFAAEHLADTIKLFGYDCWFDVGLTKGRDFGRQLEGKIRASKAVVVMWCTLSVGSEWVQEEVDLAKQLNILIPVKIEPCELPVGNRRADFVDLTGWDGSPRSHFLDSLMDAITQHVGRAPTINYNALREFETLWRRYGERALTQLALQRDPSATDEASSQESDRNPQTLLAIWQDLKPSTNLDRLRRFWEQVRGTVVEPLVEERIEALERLSDTMPADWLKAARPVLSQIGRLYAAMAWRQDAPVSGDDFGDQLKTLVRSLPPIDPSAPTDEVKRVLNEYLSTTIHHGNPIPDDYTITPIIPPGCVRPGLAVSYYNREGFGDLFWDVRFGPPDPARRHGVFLEPEVRGSMNS
jgi:hypothetical protein